MRRLIVGTCIILAAFLIVSPISAQRAAPGGAEAGAGRGVDSGSSSASSGATYSSTSSTSSYAYSSGSSAGYSYGTALGNRGYDSPSSATYVPRLEGTSFGTVSEYNQWHNYYSYLYSMYHIYPTYFARFTRNYEPRITPAMLRIALRDPLMMTREMLRAIDELETLLAEKSEGKAADRNNIIAKSQEIRDLAREIRQNQTISIIDVSSNKVAKAGLSDHAALDPETVSKLREMALDLNRQLTNLYSQPSASTVSVDSFRAPSFESQAKAIEKICKNIEQASKRL
jgi:hypothetical protein